MCVFVCAHFSHLLTTKCVCVCTRAYVCGGEVRVEIFKQRERAGVRRARAYSEINYCLTN